MADISDTNIHQVLRAKAEKEKGQLMQERDKLVEETDKLVEERDKLKPYR